MSETIVIELNSDLSGFARAGVVGASGEWLRDIGVPEIPGQTDVDVVCVLSGEYVAVQAIQLPDFPDAKLLKILPGIMDEQIAAPRSGTHFALLGTGAEGRLVAVVDGEVMHRVQETLKAAGIPAVAVIPDFMLLEAPEEGEQAVSYQGRVLVRSADGTGFTAEAAQAGLMMAADSSVRVVDDLGWQALLGCAIGVGSGLMQGSFKPAGNLVATFQWFTRSAVLAAASLAIFIGATLYQAAANNARAEAYYAEAERVFREALPETRRIVNLEAQMRRAVLDRRQQGGNEFFRLSQLVFAAVRSADQIMLESLRYDQEDSELVLNVSFASFAEGEAFKASLQQAGALVQEGSSRQEGARVFSELTIRRAS